MNYIKYNNFVNIFKIKLFVALFLIKIIGIFSISSGANEPIADNELQLTAKDCSMQFCLEKNSLSLWLSLQNVCFGENANPYFLETSSQETISQETTYSNNVSPIISASICSIFSLSSFILGYIISDHMKSVYTQVKEEDDF